MQESKENQGFHGFWHQAETSKNIVIAPPLHRWLHHYCTTDPLNYMAHSGRSALVAPYERKRLFFVSARPE